MANLQKLLLNKPSRVIKVREERSCARQWNRVYQKFDQNRPFVWDEKPTKFFAQHIKFLRQHDVHNILEAGCGDGRDAIFLAKNGFTVTGVDISSAAIKKCRYFCRSLTNVHFKRMLLEKIEALPQKFDAIICMHTLVHIKNVNVILKNFYKIL